jgi:hypothetical protein
MVKFVMSQNLLQIISMIFFFVNIAASLVSKLQNPLNIFSVDSEPLKSFYAKIDSIFSLKTVSENFVHKELLKLNPYKSTGLDNIPSKFIRDGAGFLKIPITFIINYPFLLPPYLMT